MEQRGSVQHIIEVSTQVHPFAATTALSLVSCLIASLAELYRRAALPFLSVSQSNASLL